MGEAQSQKRGVRSESQKLEDAREGYDTMGSTSPQDGAFGKQTEQRQTDQDLALTQAEKKRRADQR